jgi:hypothetical protein
MNYDTVLLFASGSCNNVMKIIKQCQNADNFTSDRKFNWFVKETRKVKPQSKTASSDVVIHAMADHHINRQ